jgi:hypothetical protein
MNPISVVVLKVGENDCFSERKAANRTGSPVRFLPSLMALASYFVI